MANTKRRRGMATSLKGSIVIINFPFSDLSSIKKLPALIIADWNDSDVILAQITSVYSKDIYSISLNETDFIKGSLFKPSFIRPNKLFTADKKIFHVAGTISANNLTEVILQIQQLLNG